MKRRLVGVSLMLAVGICAVLLVLTGAAAATPPVLTMGAATNPTYTTIDVEGVVNPEGESGEWFFQISSNGGANWERKNVSGQFGESVEGTITGLKAGATYKVRLAAYNYSEFVEVFSSELEFTTEAVPTPTVTIDPVTSHTGTTAQLSGSITANSPVGDPSAADVRWHFQCSAQCTMSNEGTVTAGQSEAVDAEVSGLEANTEYTVTLVGENAGGSVSAGPVAFKTSIVAPAAETLAANTLGGGTNVKLRGNVDPNNSPAEYWFEYGASAAYGHIAPAVGHADAGAGRGHVVSQEIGGLTPDTTYHYQLVAEGPGGPDVGGDVAFTTAPSADQGCPNEAIRRQQHTTRLPECRAYELVSPADKAGGEVGSVGIKLFNQMLGLKISSNGDAAIFPTSTAQPGATSSSFVEKAVRSATGWNSMQVSLPAPAGVGLAPPGALTNVSADLSTGIFMESRGVSAEELFTGTESIFLHGLEAGGFKTLLNPGQEPGVFKASPQGQSEDLTHAIFSSTSALTADAPSGAASNLYDYTEGGLHLLSILPDGLPDPIGAVLGHQAPDGNDARFNAVSDDGTHVVFTALSDNQVYQRIGNTRTVEVSASQGGADPTGAFPAKFVGATTTGSKVFFTSAGELTPDANTGGHSGADLYQYDVATGNLTDLTVDRNPGDAAGANVLGLAGLADDGSTLYVVAEGVLAAGGRAGQPNIYAVRPGGATEFVAALNPLANSPIWEGGPGQGSGSGGSANAQVSPSGRYLAFATATQVTPDAVGGFNAYLYDADANPGQGLVCVSCGPGDAEGGEAQVSGYDEINLRYYQPRFVFDDGRMFFISSAPLVEEDTNGRFDVYEYRHGAVSLISSGRANANAEFVDATPDAHDVLIVTTNRLLAADHDEAEDLYDVRVDGGFPEPPVPTACSGEGCRPPTTPSPPPTTPASSAQGPQRSSTTSSFTVGKISSAELARFARTGKLAVRVKTGGAGTIRATLSARIGKHRRQVAETRKTVSGTAHSSLVLHLSAAARKQLADDGRLKVSLEVTFSRASRPSVRSLTLVAPKHDRKGR